MKPTRPIPPLEKLKRRLRDPLQLRLILCVTLLAAWYFLACAPIGEGIDRASKDRARASEHLLLARDIEALRTQDAKYKARLPKGTDPNEWVEYLLAGVRDSAVRLNKLEPQTLRKHGPFNLVTIRIEAQGPYTDLALLVAWIESNPRLFRVDSLLLQPTRGVGRDLVLNLTVLGVMG